MTTTASAIKAYVGCVFEPDDIVEVRLIWPDPGSKKKPRSEWHRAGDLAKVAKKIQKLNAANWGVYVGANGRKGNGGRKAGDVATCRCLFVDFDDVPLDEAQRRVDEATLPAPTITVASGRENGYHFYWRIDELVTGADWCRYQIGLINALDSDPVIKDLPRVMRLPGFRNTKHAGNPKCAIVRSDVNAVYSLVEFDHIKAPVAPKRRRVDAKTRQYLEQKTPEGSRNVKLFTAACNLVGQGWTKPQTEVELVDAARHDGLNDVEIFKTIDSAFSQPRDAPAKDKETISTRIVRYALDSDAAPFHDSIGELYIEIHVGHMEVWPMRSKAVKRWLIGLYYEKEGGAPNSQSVDDALNLLEAIAAYDGPMHDVHIRVAGNDEVIFIDLADDQWRAIRVDASGWKVVDQPDMWFRRPVGMLPLPEPKRGGHVDQLAEFINIDTTSPDSQFPLLIHWMIMAFRPRGPYPVLNLGGSHGAGKSCACTFIRQLIDPNIAALRAPPRNPQDLAITANNSWTFVQENVSEIHPWLSDCLARLSTGSAFSTRKLWSNDEETLFAACRPILINGIGETITRSDLLDRTLRITLDEIKDTDRRDEKDMAAAFKKAAPQILGAILDGVVEAIRNIASTHLSKAPRMADFAAWSVASEPAMPWTAGTFLKTYTGSQQDSSLVALEATPIGEAVQKLMAKKQPWGGSAADLLDTLRQQDGQDLTRLPPRSWPRDATRMSNILRRLQPDLRAVGIEVIFDRDKNRRTIQLLSVTSVTASVTAKNSPDDHKNAVSDTGDADDAVKQHLSVSDDEVVL